MRLPRIELGFAASRLRLEPIESAYCYSRRGTLPAVKNGSQLDAQDNCLKSAAVWLAWPRLVFVNQYFSFLVLQFFSTSVFEPASVSLLSEFLTVPMQLNPLIQSSGGAKFVSPARKRWVSSPQLDQAPLGATQGEAGSSVFNHLSPIPQFPIYFRFLFAPAHFRA
jgi:hypothetical protein